MQDVAVDPMPAPHAERTLASMLFDVCSHRLGLASLQLCGVSTDVAPTMLVADENVSPGAELSWACLDSVVRNLSHVATDREDHMFPCCARVQSIR